MTANSALSDQVDHLLQLNREYQVDQVAHQAVIDQAEAKTRRAEFETGRTKRMYEDALATMTRETYEEKLDTARLFQEQMTLLHAELELSMEIRKALTRKNCGLMDEVGVLQEIVQSKREHYKDIERVDFENLRAQLQAYRDEVEALGVSTEQIKEFSVARAKYASSNHEFERSRKLANAAAKQRGFTKIASQSPHKKLEKMIIDKKASRMQSIKAQAHKARVEEVIAQR